MIRWFAALGLSAGLCACSADSDDPQTAAPELTWSVVTNDWSGGALLSGAVGPDGVVWAVGGQPPHAGAAGTSEVLRYVDGSWERLDPGLGQQLWWVHVFDATTAIVVGDRGTAAVWNGGAWTTLDTGVPGTTLYGAWGSSPTDVWLVGGPSTAAPSAEREGDIVLHYDGTQVTRVTIPALQDKPASAGTNVFKVWGASADAVFIVGDSGLALHYDGSTWTRQDTTVTSGPLFTVAGRSADDVYAVGGGVEGVMLHWDGSSWSRLELPLSAPLMIQGVWTAPGLPVYISGWYGFTAAYQDGAFTVVETGSDFAYHAVFGTASSLWAVGGDIYTILDEYQGEVVSTLTDVPALP